MRPRIWRHMACQAILFGSLLVPAHSRAAEAPQASPDIRTTTVGSVTIVTATSPEPVIVAVCAARPDARSRRALVSRPERTLVVPRGGELWSTRPQGGSLDCVALPSSELPLGVWLGCRWLERSFASASAETEVPAAQRVGERAAALLLQRPTETMETEATPSVLSIAGRFDPGVAVDLATAHCPLQGARSLNRAARSKQSSERISIIEDATTGTPEVNYAWIVEFEEDRTAAEMAAAILGSGDASRLAQTLLYRRRRVNAVETRAGEANGLELITFRLQMNPAVTIDRAQRFVDGALKALRIVGPSPHELARARSLLHTARVRAALGARTLAQGVAEHTLMTGDPRSFLDDLSDYAQMTPERVKHAAARVFAETRRALVEVYPPDWPQDDTSLQGYCLHTVADHDTWASIAGKYSVPIGDIARANDLDPRYRLSPGQPLWIPPKAKPAGLPRQPENVEPTETKGAAPASPKATTRSGRDQTAPAR